MLSLLPSTHAAFGSRFYLTALLLLSTAAARATTLPEMTIPQTCGVQLKGGNTGAANLDLIKAAGFKWVRRGFIWEATEKTQGVYDFKEYDRLVADCKARGLGIYATMAFSNKLYGHAKDELGRTAYAKWAAALAAHYKDENIIWEIWNEPNIATFWGKHGKANTPQYAEEYTGLVKVVVPAMHQANPKALVIAGSVSGVWKDSWSWMQNCFDDGILKTGLDGWSIHPYTTKSPEEYLAAYAQLREMMTKGGAPASLPVINSERGYPVGKAEGYAGGDPALALEYQAWHVVRQYLMDLLCGVRLTNWYEWSGKEGFSLVGTDNAPNPAFNAAKTMIAQLDGYRLDKRLPLSNPHDFALRLVNQKTGGVKVVAWTSPAPGESPDKATPHAADLALGATGASVDGVDLYGKTSAIPVKAGAVTLSLTGAPQYVTVVAGKP